jgi:hypothetical protein
VGSNLILEPALDGPKQVDRFTSNAALLPDVTSFLYQYRKELKCHFADVGTRKLAYSLWPLTTLRSTTVSLLRRPTQGADAVFLCELVVVSARSDLREGHDSQDHLRYATCEVVRPEIP